MNSIKGDEVSFQRHKGCGGWGTIKRLKMLKKREVLMVSSSDDGR